ncbi:MULTISPECIES: hypothetical protein [unclassified Pseudomonas]|uniref:hypothetical protein n=1 Tax=unclassified Pseudomonas TaxID=196821 RepID=UPI0012551978|nr:MULTISPECIES: hypothetical protein [unclassified Pseudomonas]QJI21489.1 hypothetical protein HKK57_25550 [Pseudomonas sp. ADAK21]QJI23359.1 hypothetical protein HKK56_07540 [Pseudomonas sp. ADAK20]VVO23194.1 hypothetical protein PS834_04390 [Pseudomonas fluorescens]
MNKKLIVGVFVGLGVMLSSMSANAADNLFKNYVYGSALADYKEADGYYDCSEDVGGVALCIDDVSFIDHKFTAALVFSGSKLIMVSLISAFDPDLFATSVGTLAQTFKLTTLSDGRTQFDVIQAAATSTRDELATKLANFEGGAMSGGTVSYTFYEGVDKAKRYTSMASQVTALPDNTRAAEVLIAGEGADAGLVIRFGFPKLEANKISAAAKKPAEAF